MVSLDKKQLRNQIKKALNELSDHHFRHSSLKIKEQLLKEPSIIEGNTIAITISRKREVHTREIIESLWSMNKKVVVPKCHPVNFTMDFYAIENFQQLEIVYMDLLEPNPHITELVAAEEIDCMIVPGIVFDHKGYRIGYGGGYYDRFLTKYNGMLISLAFNIQIVDEVPYDTYDLPVHLIITETMRIDCEANRKGTLK